MDYRIYSFMKPNYKCIICHGKEGRYKVRKQNIKKKIKITCTWFVLCGDLQFTFSVWYSCLQSIYIMHMRTYCFLNMGIMRLYCFCNFHFSFSVLHVDNFPISLNFLSFKIFLKFLKWNNFLYILLLW